MICLFFFSSRRRHTRSKRDWSSDVCSSDLRQVLDAIAVAEEPAQRARIDDGAGEQLRAWLLALLDDRDRHLAEPLGNVRMLFEQLAQPDRARKPRGTGAHDQDADLDPLVDGIGELADEL